MEKRRVGQTGLIVSPLGLGTLGWGRDTDLEQAKEQLKLYLEAGGNLIDTAATYGNGESEKLIGTLFENDFDRQDFILCSKAGVNSTLHESPVVDASRRNLLNTLDASLSRLGTDYLDLWFVHHYDPCVRVEETLSALVAALDSGKTRYVGVSNYPSWAIAEIAVLLQQRGYELAAAQNEYSLLNREVENGILDSTKHFNAGFFAWSGLGRGVLTGKYRQSIPPDSRAASDHLKDFVKPYLEQSFQGIVEGVQRAAEGLEREPLEVALSWVRDASGVSTVLTGARTAGQLAGVLGSNDLKLPYQIRRVLGERLD